MKVRVNTYFCAYLLLIYMGPIGAKKRKGSRKGQEVDDAIRWDTEIQTLYFKEIYQQNQTRQAATLIPGLLNGIASTFPMGVGTILPSIGDNSRVALICTSCVTIVKSIKLQISLRASSDVLVTEFKTTCLLLGAFITYEACSGVIERVIPTVHYVLKRRRALTAEAFCGYALQQFGCSTNSPYLEWTVDEKLKKKNSKKLKAKPRGRTLLKRKTRQIRQDLRQSGNFVKIIHLSDLHNDPLYTVGGEANCDNNIQCCRPDSKPRPGQASIKAGIFGDGHSCDVPYSFLELTLQHIKKVHKDVEMIYITGDIVPHNVYNTSRVGNSDIIREANKLVEKYFPTAMVIPAIGNHEPHPVNQFSPENVPSDINTRWLYDVIYAAWNPQWVPNDQRNTFFKEGFYLREVSNKLKVIILNTNVCYGLNFWGMYNVKDIGGQLAWLIQELKKSANMNQKVHIVGHTPPGHQDCSKVWSRNFYNIISRYRKTVTGQFYGHLHSDEFKIFYSPNNLGVPINNLWLSPSLTAYNINNPGYKVFYADRSTYEVMDFETWIIDLEKSNMNPNQALTWFSLYRATVDYKIPDTTPMNMAKLVNRMAKDKKLFELYYQYSMKALPRQKMDTTVYQQKQVLCSIVRPYFREEKECDRVQKGVDGRVVKIPVVRSQY